ncbi:efflux RND transporter periplasmic adaptor subunit [Parvibaculaceae bacterium PLY_AMNH_Bact1]|nr:efflux RND transporter periplasmic adaptor subunit [Parvibaculaceae bacterium PLY_AMNH_Bact1]
MTRSRWIIGAGLAGIATVVLLYLSFFAQPMLSAVQPTRGPSVVAVYATGTVEPVHVARVGANVSGRIEQVLVQEGDAVVEGEVLAILDNREASAAVRELEARLEYATSDVERYRRLFRSGNTSAASKDQSEANFRSAEAALEAARVRLQEHFIRAAISGDVMRSEMQLDVGDLVTAGKVLFVLGNPSHLWVEAEVDEEDIPRVLVGQKALIRADAFEGQALEGRIKEITPFGDPIARTYRVHIALPDDTPLLAGMTTELNIILREMQDALLVPSSAVLNSSLWTVTDDNILVRNSPMLGPIDGAYVEVLDGLDESAWVIQDPTTDLHAGEEVRVTREGL